MVTNGSHNTVIPSHVAIIMDGNGRWAKQRGLDRSAGHVEGVNTVRRITEAASKAGVKYLTLYAFSTENWNRPTEEVDALMNLIVIALERETPELVRNNVRMTTIGDFNRLPEFARLRLTKCLSRTEHCTGLNLVLALSYSSRWEITEACRRIAEEAASGQLSPIDITPQTVANHLNTSGMPDPDLLIRTGGDKRVSNFLLWQIAYSEIIVTNSYWPDYTVEEFLNDISEFGQRERRFGKTSEQIAESRSSNT